MGCRGQARLIGLFLVALVLIGPSISSGSMPFNQNASSATRTHILSNELPPFERNWTIKVVFVGFNNTFVNQSIFLDALPDSSDMEYAGTTVPHHANYELIWASEYYEKDLKDFMVENSINGTDTGTLLNETALLELRDNPSLPLEWFDSRAGRAIDGDAVEEWLHDNPAVSDSDNGWNLYILNFTELDTQDHSLEHWFTYDNKDPDSDATRELFQPVGNSELSWNLTFQYSGIGGRYNTYLLDPSADQWYLRWASIWYNNTLLPGESWPDHMTKDLDDIHWANNLSQTEGKVNLTMYLARYCEDIITNLFIPGTADTSGGLQPPFIYSQNPDIGSLLLKVFIIDTDVTLESIQWITSEGKLQTALTGALGFPEWDIDVEYAHLEDHSIWQDLFLNNSQLIGPRTIVDGDALLSDIATTFGRNGSTGGIEFLGAVFVKKQMIMQTSKGNQTGISSSNVTLVCKPWEQMYQQDNTTNREGITVDLLQQIGFLLGLNYTSAGWRYASDMAHAVMSSFSSFSEFSIFEASILSRMYLDEMEYTLRQDFLLKNESIGPSAPVKTYTALSAAIQSFSDAQAHLVGHEWDNAYTSLLSAKNWTRRMWWSLTDSSNPLIAEWGVTGEYNRSKPFLVWANITDDESGLEKVVVVSRNPFDVETEYRMIHNSSHYIINMEPLSPEGEYQLWIEALDWAMNLVYSYRLTFEVIVNITTTIDPYVTMPIVVASSIGLIVVVIVLAYWYDKRNVSPNTA